MDGATPRKILFPTTSNRDPRLVAGKHTNTLWEMNTVSTVDTIRNVEMSQVLQKIGSTLGTRRPGGIRDGKIKSLEDDTDGRSEGEEDRLIEGNNDGAKEGTADCRWESSKDTLIEGKRVEDEDDVGLILGTTDGHDVGIILGIPDGHDVGIILGTTDGHDVGIILGTIDGHDVGIILGTIDGDDVGLILGISPVGAIFPIKSVGV